MRKFCVFIATLCLMAALCVTASATQAPADGVVIRVSGETSNKLIFYGDYEDHATGWSAAIDLAENSELMEQNGFKRVVIDFYADWKAKEGKFGSGDGFGWNTLYFPDDVKVAVNLNGHTINRALSKYEKDGEVMYFDDDCDVIINNGTIKGGWSCNGAGGLHIHNDATVVLNNVNVTGNHVEDDDGAGIAVYDGAELTMNGGCISDNSSCGDYFYVYGGGVYVEDASAYFNDVTFENNQGTGKCTYGAAVYADDSTVVMDECKVIENGLSSKTSCGAFTIIHILNDSKVTLTDTDFLSNGFAQEAYVGINTHHYTSVIKVQASRLTMDGCTFTDNNQVYLIDSEAAILSAVDCDFTDNDSFAFFGNCAAQNSNSFTDCCFSYNEPMLNLDDTFFFSISHPNITFIDCDLGDATFNDRSRATFVNSGPAGSILGEGSLTRIVAMTTLAVSVATLVVTVSTKKKKAAEKAEDKT